MPAPEPPACNGGGGVGGRSQGCAQFVVVFHDRTREDFAAFDVDGHVGYQVLVVQGDDRFVGRPFGDG